MTLKTAEPTRQPATLRPPAATEMAAASAPETDCAPEEQGRLAEAARPSFKPSRIDRIEAWASRLSAKNNFWQRLCSLIWLPMAFRSGIRMKRVDSKTFTAVLPFRRFNRNWYNAMAGAALLANSEIAGGMYVFGVCGADYECVCKRLEYRFMRPCFGPALYRVTPRQDLDELVARGHEFNIELELDIIQHMQRPGARERRVGKCYATFHATPKAHKKSRKRTGRRARSA